MSSSLNARPRLRVPSSARAGEVIEIRTLIEHPMQTGLNEDARGQRQPRDMLARFVATANGADVFTVDFGNGTSANPALTFYARVDETTEFSFVWHHEDGRSVTATAEVTVG